MSHQKDFTRGSGPLRALRTNLSSGGLFKLLAFILPGLAPRPTAAPLRVPGPEPEFYLPLATLLFGLGWYDRPVSDIRHHASIVALATTGKIRTGLLMISAAANAPRLRHLDSHCAVDRGFGPAHPPAGWLKGS